MPAPVFPPKKSKPPTKTGRPCLLTKERQAQLMNAIADGVPLKQAAMLAGISYDSLNRWRARGEAFNAPLIFRQFCKALERANAKAMHRLVTNINEAGKSDWRASAWMLERRFGDEFAKPQKLEHSGPQGNPISLLQGDYGQDCEVLSRIKKTNAMREVAKKFGAILIKHRKSKEAESAG